MKKYQALVVTYVKDGKSEEPKKTHIVSPVLYENEEEARVDLGGQFIRLLIDRPIHIGEEQ